MDNAYPDDNILTEIEALADKRMLITPLSLSGHLFSEVSVGRLIAGSSVHSLLFSQGNVQQHEQ